MLRELVAELDSVLPSSVQIEARCQDCGGPHGQPRVLGSRVRISIAHCPAAIVVVATHDRAIGADVEVAAGPTSRVDAIGAVTGTASLEHWTQVEAVLKADGRGLRVDPRSVEITGQDARVVGRGIRYRLQRLELGPALVGSVAVAELPATPA
jgi:4'-phosphopantetheinyl transferase